MGIVEDEDERTRPRWEAVEESVEEIGPPPVGGRMLDTRGTPDRCDVPDRQGADALGEEPTLLGVGQRGTDVRHVGVVDQRAADQRRLPSAAESRYENHVGVASVQEGPKMPELPRSSDECHTSIR